MKNFYLYQFSGMGYTEMYEWEDKNTNNDKREGLFVTLSNNKIRLANKNDSYVLGVISATPLIVTDSAQECWHGKYLTDVFGRRIKKLKEYGMVTEKIRDKDGTQKEIVIEPAHEGYDYILNPEYDPGKEYISREDRPEYSPVGTHGKITVVDDGTCEVNGYCWPGENGIATKETFRDTYRVIERLDETHIRIVIK